MRSLGLALAILLGSSVPALASPDAVAAASGPRAALVVDVGARTTAYCVALDGTTVSGTHLIELASEQYGLSYRLGFGGRAVCMLDGVGASGGDCFGAYPDFWGYFHGAGDGGWTWATGSAADYRVASGAVDGWAWGSGDDGATHTAPASTTIDDICDPAAVPPPSPLPSPSPVSSPSPVPSPSPRPTPTPSSSSGGNTGAGVSGTDPSVSTSPTSGAPASPSRRPSASVVPSASPSPAAAAPRSASPDVVRAAAADPPAPGGPPFAGVVAIGMIALLGAGGWLTLRRRGRGGG